MSDPRRSSDPSTAGGLKGSLAEGATSGAHRQPGEQTAGGWSTDGRRSGPEPGGSQIPRSQDPGGGPPGGGPPGQVPPGPPDPPGSPSGGRRRPALLIGAGIAGFVLLAGAAFAVTKVLVDTDGGSDVEVATVEFVEANDSGPSPFTVDASTVDDDALLAATAIGADLELDEPPAGPGLRISMTPAATDRGVVYGSRERAVCDVELLAESLAGDDEVREAWANLMGIRAADVDETIAGLHPLVLTRDTAVTNSIYSDGEGQRFPAVLQAGTAVLVHPDGTPAVQCACGNPLSPPEFDGEVEIDVDPWPDFEPERIIEITPLPEGEVEVPTIDVDTGDEEIIELGTSELIELDGYLVDDADGVYVVDEDGERTRILDHPVAAVFDDGAGGILYQHVRSAATDEYRPTRDVRPANEAEAAIWHLAAGETEPIVFRESELGSDGWLALDAAGQDAGGRRAIAYLELDGTRDCSDHDLEGHCIVMGEDRGWVETIGGDRATVFESTNVVEVQMSLGRGTVAATYWHYEYNGIWYQHPDRSDELRDSGPCWDTCAHLFAGLVGTDRWLAATDPDGSAIEICPLSDASGRCEPIEGTLPPSQGRVANMTGDRGILNLLFGFHGAVGQTFVIDLTDGAPEPLREIDLGGRASIVSAPLLRPTTIARPTDTPDEPEAPVEDTAPPAPESPDWEQIRNAEIPAVCGHAATRLVDGVDTGIPEGNGVFRLLPEMEGETLLRRGLGSPDGPLTAVVAECNLGGVSWPHSVFFFGEGGRYVASTMLHGPTIADDAPELGSSDEWNAAWEAAGLSHPARTGISSIEIDGDQLVVRVMALAPDDAECCASATAEVRVRVEGGRTHLVSIDRTS